MKKALWAGLIIVLAGGAVITATAIDGKKSEPTEATVQAQDAEAATEQSPAENTEAAGTSGDEAAKEPTGSVGAPTVEPVTYGNTDAPIIIEEFASFTCPHCAHFHKETLPQLSEEFLDKGNVQLHMYSFVRNEQDLRATQLIYCVKGNEARQRFVKAVLQAQDQWAFSTDFLNNLRVMAQVGGISNEEFDKCIADKATEDKILKNREYAIALGIASTPFFVIGKEEIKGARDIETFRTAIEDATKNKAGK